MKNKTFVDSKLIKEEGRTFRINIYMSLSNDNNKNNKHCFYSTFELKIGRVLDSCGSDSELLLKHFPEYKSIIDLHMADYEGKPCHYLENGYYYLRRNKETTIKYLRINESEYEQLNKANNIQVFEYLLNELGIINRWKEEADRANSLLENLISDNNN